jgi:predicted alpha-1,2-mannosidase
MIASLTALAERSDSAYYPRWEFLNAYSGCMIGNPAVSILADAYQKGIRNYDTGKAFRYALNTCKKFDNGPRGYSGDISRTLEYAYDDWCLATLAKSMGKRAVALEYFRRAKDYRNIYDTTVHWFRPRQQDGSWEPWPKTGRLTQGYGCVESNPYQQGWFVPQDVPGMVKLMGGKRKVTRDLQHFFQKTPENMMWNNYYNQANEPVHHVAFLFNRLGVPWLTQKWSREICRRAYHNSVEGLVGNDDVGQMSAWYVLAAAGLYPLCPGDPRYEITSPIFNRITIRLDPAYAKGKTFTIIAHGNSSGNIYIQSARLNGKPYDRCYINYQTITAGGTLELEMGDMPQKHWGVK